MRDKLNSAWKWKPIKENDDFDLGDMGDLDGEFDLGDMDLGDDLDLDNDLLGKLFRIYARGFTAIYSIQCDGSVETTQRKDQNENGESSLNFELENYDNSSMDRSLGMDQSFGKFIN